MNILYTITSYLPSMGGAQLYLHEMAKRIMACHNVKVASFFNVNRTDWLLGTTLRAPASEDKYTYENVPVSRISFTKNEKIRMSPYVAAYYLNKAFNINALADFIESKLSALSDKIDLIHNVRVGREPLSYASYYLARKLKIPFVFTPLHHPRWSHWFFKEYQKLYCKADALFSLTPYEKELYMRMGIDGGKIFVTGTGPVLAPEKNSQRFRTKYGLPGMIVLFIGQGYKYKGIACMLAAARIVFKHRADVNFVFIGPHTAYSQKLFIRRQDSRIMHIGIVDLQTKTDALAACDIFCLPSLQESFGAVYLEAWSMRKPVIGSDIPQISCLIKDGINGYAVTPDPETVAKKIMVLLDDPGLREKMGSAGNKFMEENFNWSGLCDKTIFAYEEAIKKYEKNKN